MRILRLDNVHLAVRYARQCQDEGEFDLFRGQVQRWPMVPTYARLSTERREDADARIARFVRWVEGTGDVAAMLPSPQARYAVAQHYGLPTSLLDVTSDPRIAGFFASHAIAPPPAAAESCIFCFHSARLQELMRDWHAKALADGFDEDEVDLPAHFAIDVANLWRLQAQFGSFIWAPDWLANDPEERLLERMFEATCLVFPYTAPYTDVDARLVYPDRKSALEIRLDEWFALEAAADRQRDWRAAGATIIDAESAASFLEGVDLTALGFKPEVAELLSARREEEASSIFDADMDVGAHPSWTDPDTTAPWVAAVDEHFHDVVTNERWQLVVPDEDVLEDVEEGCVRQVQDFLDRSRDARRRTIHWELCDDHGGHVPAPDDGEGEYPDPERRRAADWLALVWDGMRSLPYDDEEVAIAMGRSAAALSWIARGEDPWSDEAWGGDSALRLELVMAMGFDPVVLLPESALSWALREDLPLLLDERWLALTDDPSRLLLAVNDPRILFDFTRWRRVFAAYLVPSQLLMNAQGGASVAVYNPILPVALRLH